VFDTACTACHGAGIAGAPKFGDKAAWAPRIAEGTNTLYTHALQGFQGKGGVMPPKGGYSSLSDADVKAAVDYMVSAAK
jgi:cytochrome c5